MNHKVIDFHCDVLCKLQMNESLTFDEDLRLSVNRKRISEGQVAVQVFAIFIAERLGEPRIYHVLDQLQLFMRKVVPTGITPLLWKEDVLNHLDSDVTPQALLSLEGAAALESNLDYVKLCFEQGIRILGLAWNHANWAVDGVMEPRNGGFTLKGLQLVQACHDLGMLLDVSHLSEQGFWELAAIAEAKSIPFIASHSNAYQICDHPRNLKNNQIQTLIQLKGRIGITFVPRFVKKGNKVTIGDILMHLEHICSLGGENIIMFGSDFDGIDQYVEGLEHSGHYSVLINELLKVYSETLVQKWTYGNASSFLRTNLPVRKKTL
ncbi:membrane dipeptidase [Paenibacillus shirakamiensis]|uniref:Membrane dipeptidase n=1 Tax=Paenibacillus shirakamiensis TaxID=1265935 RepID=A0ABS4JIU3_9BACL|nr:membrane dipeptidase [Paenibacillus shirakamiensis]MBP2001040.1 membrane dipeptidase [Paenibacillus shirakamiensis]